MRGAETWLMVPPSPARGDARDGRLFQGVFAALVALHLLPLLLPAFLPMQDLPNHLAMVATLQRRATDPAWDQTFVWRLGLQPYCVHYALTYALAQLLGVVAANKAVLALYVVGLPCSFAVAARTLGARQPWGALAAFPLIYSDFYLVGLTNQLLSWPLALLGLASAVALLRAESADRRLIVGLALLGLLTYLAHPLSAMLLVVTAVLLVPLHGRAASVAWSLLPLTPTALLLAKDLILAPEDLPSLRLPAWDKLVYLLITPLLTAEASSRPLFAVAAVGLLGALGVASARLVRAWRERGEGASRAERWRGSPLALVAVFWLLYAALPFGVGPVVWLDSRVGYWGWVIALLALAPWLGAGWLDRALLGVALGASWLAVGQGHRVFQQEIAPLARVIADAPDGQRMLPLVFQRTSQAFAPHYARSGGFPFFSLHVQAPSYYHLAHGGRSPFMNFHGSLDWTPLAVREPLYAEQFSIMDPFRPVGVVQRMPALAPSFDLLLVRGGPAELPSALRPWAELEREEGAWKRYRVRPLAAPGAGAPAP